MMVAMLHGEMEPAWKSAPLKKLAAVRVGAGGTGGETVRLKVWLKLPAVAVTVTAPEVAPAVTPTCARPLGSVSTMVEESEAGPLNANVTRTPLGAACPVLTFTCTTRGEPKVMFSADVWLLPEIICTPLRVTSGTAVAVKITELAADGQAGHVALI